MRHEKALTLLDLARRLAGSAEGMTLDEMAEATSVGRRTAERMRNALLEVFPQMEELQDGPFKRYRIPNGLDGFAQTPTMDELLELEKAAEAARISGASTRAAALESLDHKLRSAMRSSALRKVAPDLEALVGAELIGVRAGPRPYEDKTLIAQIRQALMAIRTVEFRYLGGRTPGQRREVTPYGLIFDRFNYFVAAELGSTEPHNWRLDRIKDLVVTERIAAPPDGFSLDEYAARSFGIYQDEVHHIVLRVRPEAADEALAWRFHPTQRAHVEPDGSVLVEFEAGGLLELAWHLFTWGNRIQVVEPAALKSVLIGELRQVLAHHESDATGTVESPA